MGFNITQIINKVLPVEPQGTNVGYSNFIKKSILGYSRYAFLGDSITDTWSGGGGAGGGASDAAHGYPQIVHRKLKEKYGNEIYFTNRGVGGNSTKAARNRIANEITPYNYDLVGVALGTNDWNNQLSLTIFEADYRLTLDDLINTTNAEIICIGLGYFGTWKPELTIRETSYNDIIKKLAKEYGLHYVDVRGAMMQAIDNGQTFAGITLAADPVHPNDAGHQIWADEVFRVIELKHSTDVLKPKKFRYRRIRATDTSAGDLRTTGTWGQEGPYTSIIESYARKSTTVGDSFEIPFEGDKAVLYFIADADCGKINVTIDGVVKLSNFDLYRTAFRLLPITFDGLGSGSHLIKVEVATKHATATGNRVSFNVMDTYVSL